MKALCIFAACAASLAAAALAEEANEKADGAPPPSSPSNVAEVAGVGAALGFKDGVFYVADLLPNFAAAASKLVHKGDRILAVGEGEQASHEVAGHTLTEVVAMIRGKVGSWVRLTVAPAGENDGVAWEVLLTRRKLGVDGGGAINGLFIDGHLFEPGGLAPELPYVRLSDGQKVSLGASHRGKIVVIEFWATWCGPCQEAMENLQKTADKLSDRKDKIDFVTMSVDGAEDGSDAAAAIERVAAHLKKKGWTHTVNGWSTFAERKAWGVSGVPTVYIIGADGKIITGDPRQSIEEVIAQLLTP